jgi:RHS repeat-associated protein
MGRKQCCAHRKASNRLTRSDGQVMWQWAYSAFGDEEPTTGAKRFTSPASNPSTGRTHLEAVTFNLRYPGQVADGETGLSYNYFRSYDARTGRYTQGDPIGLDGGWNRFAYVNQNPLSYVDPEGLQASTDPWFGHGGDQGFKTWWHDKQKGPVWFSDADKGFNPKFPNDIPNKDACDALKANYDSEKAEEETRRQQRKSNGPRPQRQKGDKKSSLNDLLRRGGRGGSEE